MMKLNPVAAKALYLEKVSLLTLRESADLYIKHSSSTFVDLLLVFAAYTMIDSTCTSYVRVQQWLLYLSELEDSRVIAVGVVRPAPA